MLNGNLNIDKLSNSILVLNQFNNCSDSAPSLSVTSDVLSSLADDLSLLSMSYAYFVSFTKEQGLFELPAINLSKTYLFSEIDHTTDFNVRINELHSHTVHWAAWFFDNENNPKLTDSCLREGVKAIISLYSRALEDISSYFTAFYELKCNGDYQLMKFFDSNSASDEFTLTLVDNELTSISNKVISAISSLIEK